MIYKNPTVSFLFRPSVLFGSPPNVRSTPKSNYIQFHLPSHHKNTLPTTHTNNPNTNNPTTKNTTTSH
jgi:hypothetical protein